MSPQSNDRLAGLPQSLRLALEGCHLLKVIAGLSNRDLASVLRIARAAAAGGADLIDVACDPSLVRQVAATCPNLPICVSAVDPELFPAAVAAGAAMLEIGNFDSFYAQGRIFTAADVLDLTHRTRSLLPRLVLSVTVPHLLPLDQQEQLAVDLERAGADIIQTEGGTSARPMASGILGLIESGPYPGSRPCHQSGGRPAGVVRLGAFGGHRAHGLRRRCQRCGGGFGRESS